MHSQGIAVDPNVLLTERRRRQAAEEAQAEEAHAEEAGAEEARTEEGHVERQSRTARETSPAFLKRKAEEQKAIEKIKKSKKFQSMKNRRGKCDSSEDSLALEIYKEEISRKAGQLENCEKCGKRFTVTPYTKAGPKGGLLCPKCAKDLYDVADKPAAKKKKAPGSGHTARQKRAEMLDGVSSRGSRSLFDLCLRVSA
ncbi:MAG: hypothetical protein M1815_003734 [Lichina confinis]|nr:MAG: hypothetical protein M1815_003734 [Lichina confinis]